MLPPVVRVRSDEPVAVSLLSGEVGLCQLGLPLWVLNLRTVYTLISINSTVTICVIYNEFGRRSVRCWIMGARVSGQ